MLGFDYFYTFTFALLIIFSFTHLTYHYFYKKKFNFKINIKELLVEENTTNSNAGKRQDFTFLYLILVIPVTIIGSILSGGFIDIFGYRYFSFPIALCLILWILALDSEAFFDRFYFVIIAIYILLLGIAFFSCKELQRESGRDNYYQLYKSGIYIEQEKIALCLNHISEEGFYLRGGIANYSDARGVSYKTKNNNFILPILNDAMPFFWMSSLGPLKQPERYNIDYYNFAVLNDVNKPDPFNFNTSTIGANLPKPSETFKCGDRQIWLYKNQTLDRYIKEKIRKFLILEA